ncbi:MAG: GNVR domain-containing protein [bacterium]
MQPRESEDYRVTLWDHLARIIRWRRTFIVLLGLFAVASVVYALLAQQWFRSNATVLPPPADQMGLSSLLPGFGMGAIGLSGFVGNESYLAMAILESRNLRDAVIDNFDWSKRYKLKSRQAAYLLYEKLIRWQFTEEGSLKITVDEKTPEYAANTVNFIVQWMQDHYVIVIRSQAKNQREYIGKRVDETYDDIHKLEDEFIAFQKTTGVVSVEEQVRASVESAAEIYKSLVLSEVNLKVMEQTLPQNSTDISLLRERVKAYRGELERITKKSDNDATNYILTLDVAPEIGVRYYHMERELELQSIILQFLLPQFEQARISELRENSNVYVLDWGQVPDKRIRPKRAFVVIAGVMLGFIIVYTAVSFVEWVNHLEKGNHEKYNQVRYVLHYLKIKNFFRKDSFDEFS